LGKGGRRQPGSFPSSAESDSGATALDSSGGSLEAAAAAVAAATPVSCVSLAAS